MAWDKPLTAAQVITRTIEMLGLAAFMNRGYDSLVTQGATSVRRPKLPTLVVKKNTGTAANSGDRKRTKTDTVMVETALDVYAVPILDEIAGKFESNDMLRQEFVKSASMHLSEEFDKACIEAAQATSNKVSMKGDVLAWEDITGINAFFNVNKVPKDGRIIVISAALETQFWNIDVIKSATGFNLNQLNTGKFIEIMGMKFFISGNVPQVDGKDNIIGIYGMGLAFILSKFGDIKEAYSPDELADAIDFLGHAAAELDDNKFAIVVKSKI